MYMKGISNSFNDEKLSDDFEEDHQILLTGFTEEKFRVYQSTHLNFIENKGVQVDERNNDSTKCNFLWTDDFIGQLSQRIRPSSILFLHRKEFYVDRSSSTKCHGKISKNIFGDCVTLHNNDRNE